MMGACFGANGKGMRLHHPHITPATAPIRISFNGASVEALPGESIAAALSAAGILALRETPKGTKRGLWCGMGACFDCVVTVDGKAGQRACMVKVTDGMAIESAFPAEPASLGRAPAEIAEQPCDILVVGAGPAGLSAAIAAAEAGAQVVVLDEREAPGGQYLKPLATSHSHAAPDAQFRQGSALFARAREAGIRFHYGATVWGGFAPD
jgi:NADPH-dependent 2,4-dienoyl-CoA reductase/sulfur reductase-like enzyme